MVPNRGRQANDPSRGKRIAKTNVRMPVSTPFWPTGFPREDSRPKPGELFITRQSESSRGPPHGQVDGPPKRAHRHPGTTKVGEQASDNLPELDSVSRSTFQWSRTFPGEPSGHFHGKQRSQRSSSTPRRSPSTSRHSGNIENPGQKSLGLPGPTVPDRRRRANDSPRGKRTAKTNVGMHKEQSGTKGH
ncbi:hypothetical protein CRG98_008786 [Punica granatum]|uniref:Uncharacterized protein n=1 Tax=Punica granatum TaxID=22663 RepID=A0A2I0KQT7_PUNGR|nr:hypothetical protein CRG98_008786 [Punica granatum]